MSNNITPDFLKKEVQEGKKRPGLLHTRYYEEMPTFEKGESEFVYPDINYDKQKDFTGGDQKLNCNIVFGRDRDSHLFSGYGKAGGYPCASIDIVAGRMSSANKKRGLIGNKLDPVKRDVLVGNNFFSDASRIYISQKCDIDHYFGLPPGDYGRPKAEAGIGIKSDHVRVIGRNSVKIYAGGARAQNLGIKGELSSNGDMLNDARIELITNTDTEPQPMVLGSNLAKFLNELLDKVSSMEEAFALQNINMIKLQMAVASHFHTGVGVGVVVSGPDPILASIALGDIPTNVQKINNHLSKALNFQIMKMNYLGIPVSDDPKLNIKTTKNILSRNVFTT